MGQAKRSMRKQHHVTKPGAKALAAGAAIAAGTQAYADPIRFDNPPHGELGHFHWPMESLDVTLSPAGQGSGPFLQQSYDFYDAYRFGTVSSPPGHGIETYRTYYSTPYVYAVGSGTQIPSNSYFYGNSLFFVSYLDGSFPSSPIPEGVDAYLGVHTSISSQYHFGWIGVVRSGDELEAFAWGYETEPGVPIAAGAVPEPGTLVMLALGFVAAGTRRHQ